MKKFIIVFLLVLINNWTVSYGQIGDTLVCYNSKEIQKIASRLVYASECSQLLEVADLQILEYNSAIFNLNKALETKDAIINKKTEIIEIQDSIISTKNEVITSLIEDNNKLSKQRKFLKIGLGSTSALLFSAILIILL